MGYSRGLLTWSVKYLEACKTGALTEPGDLEPALEYCWAHLEHQIDCVKHNTKVSHELVVGTFRKLKY